ncbi:hypothetical protein [Caloranaerobacter ferrireducens]|uniref:hypothetical protein n=1 Tax=Caloranaerobacter ferrireducens TaxID=1323370 RepID=UPI0009F5EA74|nr:hypothetical protein [Caloranaerobacter ferrireducens]
MVSMIKKQNRDFRDEFFGIEACLLESKEDIEALMNLIKKDRISFGIHFPLRANQWRLRDPQYLSLNDNVRVDSYNYMVNEFQYIRRFKPHYVLLHYPKPVILDDNVDWTNWRFTDDTEYYYASEYS